MSAREKSDLPKVAEKRANEIGGARGAKGRGQGECGTAEHGPDAEPGSRVTGAVPHTRSRHQEQTGQANGALASSHRRCFAASFFGLKKFAAPGVDEMTWTEYAKGLRGEPRGSPFSRSNRSVSSAAI